MENIIKKYRLKKGLTQDELAKKTGIFRDNISRYENHYANMRSETCFRFCECLDIPVEEFIAWQYKNYKENKHE